jgi:prepilin-type N-terminal cleavage/methylation domain-containing protein
MKILNNKYQIQNTNRGFTMIEMVVSLGIIAVLIGSFVVNYRGGSRNSELALTSQKTVSDLRFVQNSTLGSTRYNGLVPRGGWGIHFSKLAGSNTYYTIFADIDGDRNYDSPAEDNPVHGGRRIELPPDTTISELLFSATPKNSIDVIFLPPDPETIIWDGMTTTTVATIRLRHALTTVTKDITVNFFGMIEGQQ